MADGKSENPTISQLFVSYTREDADYCLAFYKHCSVLSEANLVEVWYDDLLEPGADWEQEINQQLVDADIIVLLISSDYVSSNFIRTVEMPIALQRHEDPLDDVAVVPVLIRNFLYEIHALGKLNILPKDEQQRLRPVNRWGDYQDEAWKQIVEAIYKLIVS
ncbi:MAG: toll/interleukin-1 receptor domain-containing protein [Bacteroidota bacterium]